MTARTSAEEWRKRVERWRESELTAEQFASELGINAGTLRFWQYKLKKLGHGESVQQRATKPKSVSPPFVEVRPVEAVSGLFELELGNGRRLRVPASFDAHALERLLGVLETK
jgi:hypothetical protein